MPIESHNERMRSSKAVSSLARYRTAAKRLMINALRAFSTGKARGRPKLFLLTDRD